MQKATGNTQQCGKCGSMFPVDSMRNNRVLGNVCKDNFACAERAIAKKQGTQE